MDVRTQPKEPVGARRIGDAARASAAARPSHIALASGDRRVTYAALEQRVAALSAWLRDNGVGTGDVVASVLPNGIGYVVLLLAVARAGAIFAPTNPRLTARELALVFSVAQPRLVFAGDDRLADARAALESAGVHGAQVLGDPDGLDLELQCRGESDTHVGQDEPALLLFTSGTGGRPKGVVGTHAARMAWVRDAAIEYGLAPQDVYLAAMPQTHSAGLTFTLMHLHAGACIELMPRFEAAAVLDRLAAGQATSLLAVPAMLALLVEEASRRPRWSRPAALRRIVSCGAPFSVPLKLRVRELLCENLYEYYGSTECSGMTLLRPQDLPHRAASVGRPFGAVRIKVVDAEGRECAPGHTGEVWAANPYGMRGYKDRPDATQAAFSGAWYRTGDLGWMDDDGYLHLAGRRDDMLVTGGFNVQPQEVDDVLCLHPDVQEAAVTGEPDPVWGQVLVAHVVVKPGAAFDADALRTHCQERLASYKVPRRWRECGPLPRNGAGKLMRAQLGASAPGAAAAA